MVEPAPSPTLPFVVRALGMAMAMVGALLLAVIIYVLADASKGETVYFGKEGEGIVFQMLFFLHVPIIMALLMIPGGIGLYMQKGWSWSLGVVPSLVGVVLSIQLIISVVSAQWGQEVGNNYLPIILILQSSLVANLVYLFGGPARRFFKVKLTDILMTGLFAAILLLDWLVTLYDLISN